MSKHTVVARARVGQRDESTYDASTYGDIAAGGVAGRRTALGERRDTIDLREEVGRTSALPRCDIETSPFVVDWAPPAR